MLKILFFGFMVFAQHFGQLDDGWDSQSKINVSVLTEKQATQLFQDFVNSDIPFKYPIDGCFARATEMTRLAEAQKIEMAKIFAEGTLNSKIDPYFNPPPRWDFHVAAILYVLKDGKPVKMVFDPGLFDEPVTVERWKERLVDGGRPDAKITDVYTGTKYYTYNISNERDGIKKSWQVKDLAFVKEVLAEYSSYLKSGDIPKTVDEATTRRLVKEEKEKSQNQSDGAK